MKLYTEKEVINAVKLAHSHIKPVQYVLDTLTPIELPSDEEIYEKAVFHDGSDYSLGEHNGFIEGAKWMRNKIQGGNK